MSLSNTFEPTATFFSSDATPPRTFDRWPDLPAELKLEVLAKVLVLPALRTNVYTVDAESHHKNTKKLLFPLIVTRDRILVDAALDVYYKRNHFNVEVGVSEWSRTTSGGIPSSPGVCYPKVPTARLIRHLIVSGNDTTIRKTLCDMLSDPNEGWRWLLKPLYPGPRRDICELFSRAWASAPDAEKDTQWQLGFSNLQTLKIFLCIHEDTCEIMKDNDCCAVNAKWRAKLVGWLEETELLLKAKYVGIECSIYSYMHDTWCTNHLDMLEGLARKAVRE